MSTKPGEAHGYSLEALRVKTLFTEGMQKKVRPKFERREDYGMPEEAFGRIVTHTSPRYGEGEKNYGADISTLIRMLEEGKL